MSDTTPPGNIWDTPDGRLLVATCSKAQIGAVIEMMTAAFNRGWDQCREATDSILSTPTEELVRQLSRHISEE